MGMAVGMPDVKGLTTAVDLAKNPLAETHEFKQACSMCYVKTGEQLLGHCRNLTVRFVVLQRARISFRPPGWGKLELV